MNGYGLRLKGKDGLCRVIGDGDYFRLVGPEYRTGEPFMVTATEMLDYLTDPPRCIQNGWKMERPYPAIDLSGVEVVEITLSSVTLNDLLRSAS